MRNGQFVTQRALTFPGSVAIVSRTDANEVMTYVNDDFVGSSGSAREAMIGQTHNIVRHLDRPAEVFCDLWDTLSKGRIWNGLVKDHCKNGNSVTGFSDPFEPSRAGRGGHQYGVAVTRRCGA